MGFKFFVCFTLIMIAFSLAITRNTVIRIEYLLSQYDSYYETEAMELMSNEELDLTWYGPQLP